MYCVYLLFESLTSKLLLQYLLTSCKVLVLISLPTCWVEETISSLISAGYVPFEVVTIVAIISPLSCQLTIIPMTLNWVWHLEFRSLHIGHPRHHLVIGVINFRVFFEFLSLLVACLALILRIFPCEGVTTMAGDTDELATSTGVGLA